tara:strand:- start:24483 stop:25562 length:1080 start_codon:yes stop_codon:yes gene_type:complete
MKLFTLFLLLFFPKVIFSQLSDSSVLISEKGDKDQVQWNEGKFNLIKSVNLDSVGIFTPYFLSVNDLGNLAILDWEQRSVYFFPSDDLENPVKVGGKKGRGPGEYETPFDIHLSNSNKIWIPDSEQRKIDIWDSKVRKVESSFKISNKWVKPDKVELCESDDGSWEKIYILSSQYGPGVKNKEGILHQYDIVNNSLVNIDTFQKLSKDDERYPYVVTGQIQCSVDGELYYSGDFSGTIRKYSSNNQLLFHRNAAGFKVEEPLFIKVKEDFTRYNPAAPRVNGESFLIGDKFYVGHSRTKDRYVYAVDVYDSENGEYLYTFKLPVPAKELAISESKIYLFEYAGKSGFNLKVYDYNLKLE